MAHRSDPYEDDLDDVHAPRPVHYAEQSLLGALLLEPHRLHDVDALDSGHFSNHAHGVLWQAMRDLPPPEPDTHRSSPAWLNAVLDAARPHAPGLTASYLHTLIQVCPWPKHAPTYARMVQADHARRTVLMHAERLVQTATDTTLPNPVATTLAQADTLGQFLDTLAGQFASHPGSLPRTVVPVIRAGHRGEEAVEEERLLLATATAHPAELNDMRWLQPDDFTLPLHAALWQCLTALVHNGEPVDAVTMLWEAQHRGLLADGLDPRDLIDLVSTPVGSPEYWGERVLQRALLGRAVDVGTRIAAYAQDPANTPHQLITGSRRALADLTTLRTRWKRSTSPPPAHRAPRGPAVSRAGPPPRTTAPSARALR
ncbi:DnaB-like helicase N-terminal domain-containing protein [Streptomyces sp. NPDC058534]|uniref:DnaB-like helicase N-terminal domain-containing protein n=1 Tax=Streptomyces sp. NPDC058534 TaxID=3346541 RepID=UPI00366871CB